MRSVALLVLAALAPAALPLVAAGPLRALHAPVPKIFHRADTHRHKRADGLTTNPAPEFYSCEAAELTWSGGVAPFEL